ncbi:maleate cis-trans isomerase [Amycolatopsis rubida]|uniref:Maleate isomerase n=1 Tax=Amycolatopsis rubida TaxID=112413 RepID=A0ABX0BSD7_9PSEU|nr:MULTISPECIES: maleate cis-trans isomerase [Amycolatopsis]MYW90767.1 maleate cis-trans isomerase [Amycolatopsis rubida]NEC55750.1 maleate cis-trans isomerase [Amycolatopsis rubida]OAP26178.1 Maleate isomerase [Amycolatopsis sp. M39]
MPNRRVGIIVPSSNITVETELPAILRRQPGVTFSFHSSRMRMTEVTPVGLASMNVQRERCVVEIADAGPDVILYACLVALMAGPPGEHHRVESLTAEQLATGDSPALVRSSAGALIEALKALSVRRVALVTPYLVPLARKVVGYLEHEGIQTADYRALEVEDNRAVGCIEGDRVLRAARELNLDGVDALVLSACVQMPSLDLIEQAEAEFGIPVLSAATAGAFSILRALDVVPAVPGAGSLLAPGR